MRRVYVENMGSFWSLSQSDWLELCHHCANGNSYDLDDPRWRTNRLSRAPRGIGRFRSRDGELSQWTQTANDVIFRQPLDWEKDDFQNEIENLSEVF